MWFTINMLMLNIPVYLYTPAIRVFIDLDNSSNLGVDHMYHGYATIAKGIKNTLRFNFLNGEQRAVSIGDKQFRFSLFDHATNKKVLTTGLNLLDDTVKLITSIDQTAVGKVLTFTDATSVMDGQSITGPGIPINTTVVSTTATTVTLSANTTSIVPAGSEFSFVTKAKKGVAELVLMGNDTVSLPSGRYTYSILREELDTNELSPVFIDGAGTVTGLVELVDSTTPKFVETTELKFLTQPNNTFTQTVGANNDGKGSEYFHTAAFYFNNFSGTWKIYGSLNNTIDGSNGQWVMLATDTIDIADAITEVRYANLTGVFNFFKFEYIPTSGSIDKVLYRS